PRISNHTDFDPLRLHPQVDLRFVGPGEPIPPADLIILPGSKSVRADLEFLRAQGWETVIQRHLRYGGKLLGICGGLQMLGQAIVDPHGLEGEAGESRGLGLLDYVTVLEPEKQLRNVRGVLTLDAAPVSGYEIHAGVSEGKALARPAGRFAEGACDGALSEDGQIMATYLHGLFESPAACAALLKWAGLSAVRPFDYEALRERDIERLAELVETRLDSRQLLALCGLESNPPCMNWFPAAPAPARAGWRRIWPAKAAWRSPTSPPARRWMAEWPRVSPRTASGDRRPGG